MSNDRWKTCLIYLANLLIHVGTLAWCNSADADSPPFSVPDGFIVQQVANDRLAHDCFCMTLDEKGRPLVSGPGYLRTLFDDDGDGIFERSVEWTREIKQGAQGLWVDGNMVYWVSDGGLWRSADSDGDGVANGRAQRILEIPTGGEHDCHAIKRGPDGFWYFIAGNFAANIGRLESDPSAPIVRARAGTLWRMSPDFSQRGVWAHGLRNAYDFDFLPDGQVVTYDSDDEREATLPWYRPTRAMVLGPGSDAGWCGGTWKDDDYRVTMPTVLARLGRGSPTGVVVYEHNAFPERYRDAVFVLDWTFGRVMAIYPSGNLNPQERIPDRIPSEIFMEPTGTAGFAPTSACIAPDGSLLISVGGRGTLGAVYRVRYAPDGQAGPSRTSELAPDCFSKAIAQKLLQDGEASVLESVIQAPSPWSAWSLAVWRPRVTPRIRGLLIDVAIGKIPLEGPSEILSKYRLRAAQLLTRLGETSLADPIRRGIASNDPAVRAAAWWIAGRQPSSAAIPGDLRQGGGTSPISARWEVHLGSNDERLKWEAAGLKRWPVSPRPVSPNPTGNASSPMSATAEQTLRRTWLWALSRTRYPQAVNEPPRKFDLQISKLLFGADQKTADQGMLNAILSQFKDRRNSISQRETMECLTCAQAALGDRRLSLPLQTNFPADVSDGYRALYCSQVAESSRNRLARWTLDVADLAKQKGWDAVHAESMRTLAMTEATDPAALNYLIDQITAESHPTSDLHLLCALSQCAAPRAPAATTKTASALAAIPHKVKDRGLYTDNQWPVRLQQLIADLIARDSKLGDAFLELPNPCCSEELALLNAFPPTVQDRARERIQNVLRSSSPAQWSPLLIKFAGLGPIDSAMRESLQEGYQIESLRQTCLSYLVQSPQDPEYALYVSALEGSDRSLWPDAWRGLSALEMRDPHREFPSLAKLVSASMNTGLALPLPAILDRTRRAASVGQRNPPPDSESWSDWSPYLQSQLDDSQRTALIAPPSQTDLATILANMKHLSGNAERGATLFQSKCALCHGGQSALGPSLSGVAKRFSSEDLARAIYDPSRDIPDRYRAVRIMTIDDEVVTGMTIYSAADGVTLQAADGSILRINQDQIQQRAFSTESIMPSGLLEDRSPQDVSDLFAYLGTLR
jgi:putative heme-binding domain-containing protein